MAQVTYRGVKYDSDEYNAKVLAEAAQRKNHDLMYDALNNGCEKHDWYAYLDFISENQYDFGGG